VRELIDEFLREAPNLVDAIVRGLREGDAEGVRRGAHTLKSNASTFGALSLAESCRTLELAAKDGELGEAQQLGRADSGAVRAGQLGTPDRAGVPISRRITGGLGASSRGT
jgi:HPt (histidine-containing phosphotransfer) domain-containing protein